MTASSGAAVDQTILPSQFHDDRANEDENASLVRRPVVLTPAQAAELVQSGDTILINGSGENPRHHARLRPARPASWTRRGPFPARETDGDLRHSLAGREATLPPPNKRV